MKVTKTDIFQLMKRIEVELREIKRNLYWNLEVPNNELIKKYIQERYLELNNCPMNKGKDRFCEKCQIIKSELALMETRLINFKEQTKTGSLVQGDEI